MRPYPHSARLCAKTRLRLATLAILACAAATLLLPYAGLPTAVVRADNTFQTLPHTQNWTNTALISAEDNWTSVPGVIGFRGDALTALTGADPRTIVADGSATPVDVNANRADPNTFGTGGVTEFDGIENPVVALAGSGTADAPHIVIHLNTTGLKNINVAYNLRDIDGSTDNAVQAVALQYRVGGGTGDYTNLPAGFVADASSGPSLATLVTPVSVTLPAACDNQAQVHLRVITTNAGGNDEWIGIDDINITGSGVGGTPSLSIGDVTNTEGDAGTINYTFNVQLTAPAPAGGVTFDISTADGTATVAGNDYVAQSLTGQTIAQGGQTYTFNVAVNGDTAVEPAETFFVNVTNMSGANVSDAQATGTINNDDSSVLAIHAIQGSGSASPFVGQPVTTNGVVTLLKNNGFFIQTPDGGDDDDDPATSQGLFVFTSVAPPIAVGDSLTAAGTVAEFFTSTQLDVTGGGIVTVNSSGNALPAAILLTNAILDPAGPLDQLERYEGMRLRADSLTSITPSDNFFDFYTVLTGVARPLREPGIEISNPLPPGAGANVPRFDENPERLVVDSNGRLGSTGLTVTSNVNLTNISGVLDFNFGQYRLVPAAAPTVSANMTAVPVPTPLAREFTIASFNIENFFNDGNFITQRDKAALAIRNVLRTPDIIGLEEIGDLSVLQSLATKVNNDAVAAGEPNPAYVAYLLEADGTGGDNDIDVGFLVKSARVNVVGSVAQEGLSETFINPNHGQNETTFDRPPLVLRATINRDGAAPLPVTVLVNHLRSFIDIDQDPGEGPRVRAKRKAGAEALARIIQSYQTADPNSNIISVGDYNAFNFNDGFVDIIGTIKGQPLPADQVTLPTSDFVNPNLFVLTDEIPAQQRYSFIFEGTSQVLDHVIVNQNLRSRFSRIAVARNNADFPESLSADSTRPERASDHDMPVAYFNLPDPASVGQVIISEFRLRGPQPSGTPDDGALDEFIELYNNTDSDITVTTADGSAGWSLVADDGAARFTIPNGTHINARGHVLAVNSLGYSLGDYGGAGESAGDFSYTVDIADGAGIALFRTADPLNFTAANRLDAVGFEVIQPTGPRGSFNNLFLEGTGLPVSVTSDSEHSHVRKLATGRPRDTDNNASDFVLIATDPSLLSGFATLGRPGPENAATLLQRNAQIKASAVDPQCLGSGPAQSACRQVRDSSSPRGTMGTLAIRRTFTNHTDQPVSALRFRVVDVTTQGSSNVCGGCAQADLRALTGVDAVVTRTDGTPVTLSGLTLEAPPAQAGSGGMNSTLRAGVINLGQPLGQGMSINVEFLLGVEVIGRYRFLVNVEAL
ncbi:MAG: Calx-beta domain-containing protein [Pyrinomonadaceae bacterium]